MTELQAGSTCGPYRLVAPLGHGGTASVYTAYDPQLDRRVALKVLPAEFLRDGNRRVERDAHDRHVHCRRSPAAQAAVRCRV